MDLFTHTWTALRSAVADLPDEYFARPSGRRLPTEQERSALGEFAATLPLILG